MFHDSGRKDKNMPSKATKRICLHCGYAYGEHFGNECPTMEHVKEWGK